MGIYEKRLERKPDPIISFFEINLDFLALQMLHVDFNIYRLFLFMKALTFTFLLCFFAFKTIRSIHHIYLYIVF